jgi:hypothetical protein
VRSPLRLEPLFVHAGELARYGRRHPPVAQPMPMRGTKPNDGAAKPRGGELRPPRGVPSNPPSHGGHGSPPPKPPVE